MQLIVNNGTYSFSGRSLNITKDKNTLLAPYAKQVYNYGIILSLLPTDEQKIMINKTIGCARVVRNHYLSERIKMYKEKKETLSVSDYKKNYLVGLKDKNKWLKEVDKFALESAIEHVDDAYKKFFDNLKNGRLNNNAKSSKKKNKRLLGFPKFVNKYKPSGNKYTTKYTNNNIKLIERNGNYYLDIPKIHRIKFILPKRTKIEDLISNNIRILSVSIQKSNDVYTASLQLEKIIDKVEPLERISEKDIYGIDLGIKDFCIYGNKDFSEKVSNPKWIKKHQKRVKRLSQSLSRKVKGSNNYNKAKAKLAKEHRKIKNQRKDFQHKLSREIINKGCKVFVCESLNIKGMVKNRKLAKEISSCGWGQFLSFVKYKIEKIGGYLIKVDRFFPSSQLCNTCGFKNEEIKDLSIREWVCPVCGTKHDRDINAKNNMISEGIRIITNKDNDYNIKIA